jgi:hypothetical protein
MIRDVYSGSRIPDLDFFHTGSRIQGSKSTEPRIRDTGRQQKKQRLNGLRKRKNCAVPDVGREISDHVDIGNDEVVLKEEVAQEVPLLVRVAVRLITQQAAHLLT